MQHKICGKCEQSLPIENFHKRGGIYQAWCKPCRKEYDKEYFQRNKKKRKEQIKTWTAERVEEYEKYKNSLFCRACGENAIECLDFHHIDPSIKDGSIANLVRSRSFASLKKEIEKCVVLCSNCHRKVHSGRILLVDIGG